MQVICDIETDGITNIQNIWCIVCIELKSGKIHKFSQKNFHKFLEFSKSVTQWIGHNFIRYDWPVLCKFFPELPKDTNILDTLILSKLFFFKRPHMHSLEAWGEQLGHPKSSFDDFTEWSQELEDRCVDDCLLCVKLYNQWEKEINDPDWQASIELEHDIEKICYQMHLTGVHFNIKKAKELYSSILYQLHKINSELQKAFPPKSILIREINPQLTKAGTLNQKDFKWTNDLTPFNAGAPFSRIRFEPFNPASPKQIVDRLNQAGWKPVDRTKGHSEILKQRNPNQERVAYFKEFGWKVNEENLGTLPENAPQAAQKLVQYITLDSRRSTLEEWFAAYNEDTGRLHPTVIGLGTWTHRKTHSRPNCANITRTSTLYGKQFRQLWEATPGYTQIGTDADGIQLRILAEYLQDDEFMHAVCEGSEDDGTDIHTLNKLALRLPHLTRDHAKTFIYAFILGAGIPRIANILECFVPQAREAYENFLTNYENMVYLKSEVIPKDAKRGFFYGFDGRQVRCDSEHLMLAGYLQNGESVIMKTATRIWHKKLTEEKIPFRQINDVHDEWQTETPSSEKDQIAHYIGQTQAESLVQAGKLLGLSCPISGSYKIGSNWYETH